MKQTDVLIVGGGPAGAACAARLQKANLSCLVLDQHIFPRFKPCAGWITPELLTDLDFTPEEYPHSLTTFRSFTVSIRGFRFRLPVRQYAIRRFEFDTWLLRRSGAPVETHRVRSIAHIDGMYVIDDEFKGKYLVGAGGTHCPVYRTFFQSRQPRDGAARIIAMEDEFAYPDADPTCRLWFFQDGLPGYAWYVPKAGGFVNVGIGGMAATLKKKKVSLKWYWESLVKNLDRSGLVKNHAYNPVGHAYFLHRTQPEGCRENAFIVGDAAGLATRDMGEGIRPAVMSGIWAADAILGGSELSLGSIPKVSWHSLLRSRFLSG